MSLSYNTSTIKLLNSNGDRTFSEIAIYPTTVHRPSHYSRKLNSDHLDDLAVIGEFIVL